MRYSFLFSFFLLIFFKSNLSSQCNHPDDYTALRALYLSTSGDNWKDNSGWPSKNEFLDNPLPSTDTDLSVWNGIQCKEGRVHRLVFFDNNLRDTLPIEMTLLSNLEFVILVRNKLRGEVLHLFANMEKIEDIRLSLNDFTGEIPIALAEKPGLNFLGLDYNDFSGPIPGSLGRLLNLLLDNNNFSGCLDPEFYDFCSKPNVDISNNPQLPWEGDADLYCQTNGDIAEQVGAPCRKFPNTYPQEIDEDCNCSPSCKHPDFLPMRNLYSGMGGWSWKNNDGWRLDNGPDCNPCSWYGVTCDDAGRVSEINLRNNDLRNAIPIDIKDLTNLKKLNLSYNDLAGEIPFEIGELELLTDLILDGNDIGGNLPESLGNLMGLDTLSLSNNKISGAIPTSMSNLTKLKFLSFLRNEMNGELPQDFSNLVDLEEVLLSSNSFSGVLPENISAMSKLKILKVDNNDFEGRLPAQLGDLDDALVFHGQRNNFSDCFDQSLLKFCGSNQFNTDRNPLLPWQGDLEQFCLTSGDASQQNGALCGLGASGTFENCECIVSTDPCYSVEGVLCKTWLQDTLSNLLCYDNGFGDRRSHGVSISKYEGSPVVIVTEGFAIASEVGGGYTIYTCEGEFLESCFQTLGVGCETTDTIYGLLEAEPIAIYNCFSDTFPDCSNFIQHVDFSALRALYQSTEGFNWKDNAGWKEGQTNIFSNPCNWFGVSCNESNRVDSISMNFNRLNGILPNEIGDIDSLVYLDISWNPISGSFPDSISKLKVLNYIDMSLGDFDIPINEAIGGVLNLEYLNLEFNEIIGTLPESLGNLKKLKYFNFDHNMIKSLHSTIGDMESLEYLYGTFNEIEDTLSNGIGNLTQLKILDFGLNKIEGFIPNSITNLIKLEELNLTHNELQGELPEEIGLMTSLSELYLGSNNIQGTIPLSFSALKKLERIMLWDNRLEGEIPNDITNLDSLKAFNLSGNKFTGTLPSSFSNTSIIEHFDLEGNDLSGCIPEIYLEFCSDVNFDLSDNLMLPWKGNIDDFCAGNGIQEGASCDDENDSNGQDDVIREDCTCGPKPVSTKNILRNVKIYPIPVKDNLYIDGLVEGEWRYEIVDLLGHSIKENIVRNGYSISLNGLLAGTYILRLHDEKNAKYEMFKIIKN